LAGFGGPSLADAGGDQDAKRQHARGLIANWTMARAELRERVPIVRRPGRGARAVLTLPLPAVRKGDRVRFNGEVTLTTTCVRVKRRCIGRRYDFDPHLRARIVIGNRPRAAGRHTLIVSRTVKHTCGQDPPDRNHHCPLVIGRGSILINRPRQLPCSPRKCRLNMVVAAHHPRARGGEVVVVGADRPNASVDDGKARLNAIVMRDGAAIATRTRRTRDRLVRRIPAAFDGGQRVVYSRRVEGLERGDVLFVRAKERTRVRRYAYFIGSKIVVATRRPATHPSSLTKQIISRGGTATEVSGFNCTLGPSAFQTPCLTSKAGLAFVRKTPTRPGGGSRPLFVNLVSRGFPKLAPSKSSAYPSMRVIRGGKLTVTRLRETSP